jgi:hypothetical protein
MVDNDIATIDCNSYEKVKAFKYLDQTVRMNLKQRVQAFIKFEHIVL